MKQNPTQVQTITLSPFLTYNPNTLQLQLNQCQKMMGIISMIEEICFVSLVQVKCRDFRIFGIQGEFGKDQGIYVSAPIGVLEELGEKKTKFICYLAVITNDAKIPQKFQDLFASIALTLSTTCVFDISSKYLRQSKNTQNRPQRNNYVIMNTYNSKIGQIYKASVVTMSQTQNSKMEISTKMIQERDVIFQEFMRNRGQGYNMRDIAQSLRGLAQQHLLLKNYMSFEEIQLEFQSEIRLTQYLSQCSVQFNQLKSKQEMLSLTQLKHLQKDIQQFTLTEFTTTQQITIFNKTKRKLIQSLTAQNRKLTHRFLLALKKQFFLNASSLGEVEIKKQLSLKILEQYGINPENVSILCYEAEQILQNNQIRRLNTILCQKVSKIDELQANLKQSEDTIAKNAQKLKIYEQKFLDFKQINIKYLQICSELQKQHEQSLKHKQQIQKILTQKQQHIKIEQNLTKLLAGMQQNKNTQQSIICSLHTDLRNKEHYIYELKNKNQESEKKIKGYLSLEDKAWRSIEDAQQAKDQLKRYKELLKSLQDHFEAFKRGEFQKFNYILKKNAQVHRKLKKQSEQKSALLQQHNKKISQLTSQLQSQKIRVKYCQQQLNIHAHLINKSLTDSQNKAPNQDKSYQLNRSFISAV